MNRLFRSALLMFSAVFTFAFLGASGALAADNPFAQPLDSLTQVAAADGKCATGKCAASKKCGGTQGAAEPNEAELRKMCAEKIRGGFCGAGKCAAGKCGDSLKASCARLIEGGSASKCGKCGGSK